MLMMGSTGGSKDPENESPFEDEWENEDVWSPPKAPTDPDGEWVMGKYLVYPIEDLQDKYHHLVQGDLTDEVSIYRYQQDHIERAFVQFGLTKQEYAKASTEIAIQSTIGLNQIANSTALEMVKMTDERPVRWNQMYMQQQDIIVKHYEIEASAFLPAMANDKWVVQHETALQAQYQTQREQLVTAKLSAEIDLIRKQTHQIDKDAQLIDSKIKLTDQQILSAKEQTSINRQQSALILAQEVLVSRQIVGYSDNLLVKSAEFQANLASFASSSGSSSAQGAIINFNQTISEIKRRV